MCHWRSCGQSSLHYCPTNSHLHFPLSISSGEGFGRRYRQPSSHILRNGPDFPRLATPWNLVYSSKKCHSINLLAFSPPPMYPCHVISRHVTCADHGHPYQPPLSVPPHPNYKLINHSPAHPVPHSSGHSHWNRLTHCSRRGTRHQPGNSWRLYYCHHGSDYPQDHDRHCRCLMP
jgi:hypothetical protein